MNRRKSRRVLVIVLAVCCAITMLSSNASADSLPGLVSTGRDTTMPTIEEGTFPDPGARRTWEVLPIGGSKVAMCGRFDTAYENVTGSPVAYTRHSVLSFYAAGPNKGRLTSLAPSITGTVNMCVLSPDGRSLIIGGNFTSGAVRYFGRVDLATGRVSRVGGAIVNGPVLTIAKGRGHYWLGGTFTRVNGAVRVAGASLRTTGALSNYFRPYLGAPRSGARRIGRMAVSPNGQYLIANHNARTVAGKVRPQIAVWRLGATRAVLANWRLAATMSSPSCTNRPALVATDFGFVPGTNDAIMVSTGGPNGGICDKVMRFPLNAQGLAVRARWALRTFGDSLFAVEVTPNITYVQGHQKQMETRPGSGVQQPDYQGLAAFATNGGDLYENWRPRQSRCYGGRDIDLLNRAGYPQGLMQSSDCNGGFIFRPYK